MTDETPARRTRLVVDIEWRGHPDGREPYYDEAERVTVATGWIEGAFEDRDDSPRITVTEAEPPDN